MAEQPIGDLDDTGRAAVVDLERVGVGTGEPRPEVDQPRRVGTVVAVDRLVVVTHAEHRSTRRREQSDQQQVGRRQILELVDEQQPAGPLRHTTRRGLGQQHLDRTVDLIVEVDDTLTVERVPVVRPHLGQTVDVTAVPRLGLDRFDAARVAPG